MVYCLRLFNGGMDIPFIQHRLFCTLLFLGDFRLCWRNHFRYNIYYIIIGLSGCFPYFKYFMESYNGQHHSFYCQLYLFTLLFIISILSVVFDLLCAVFCTICKLTLSVAFLFVAHQAIHRVLNKNYISVHV